MLTMVNVSLITNLAVDVDVQMGRHRSLSTDLDPTGRKLPTLVSSRTAVILINIAPLPSSMLFSKERTRGSAALQSTPV